MISKSDLLILVVASSALAVGIYRWHENTQDVSAITIPASNRVAVVEQPVEPTTGAIQVADTMSSEASSVTAQSGESASNPVVVQTVAETEPVQNIVVESTASSNSSSAVGVHEVRSGDYLGKIAKQYNTDVQTLRDLNGISGTVIHVGEDILYPL